MKCPECNGLGKIHVPAQENIQKLYLFDCPTCEGTGELPDSAEFPNSCPACGEPIRADEQWCETHKAAEQFTEND